MPYDPVGREKGSSVVIDSGETASFPTAEITPTDGFMVVGVGASAGGLEAFIEFLEALPASTGMAFVLVQHLDPNHPSSLTEILGSHCKIPVLQIRESAKVERNHVYIIPPNTTLSISNRVLHLTPRPPRQLHSPIDAFFMSLARDRGTNAIGVVLSGSASDGTLGLKAIKAAGGITFCQDATARFDGMPRNAITSGVVDHILSPARIAEEIAQLALHPYYGAREDFTKSQSGSAFTRILSLLRARFSVDFGQYKQPTIQRRLSRRMAICRAETPEAYLSLLQRDPPQLQALFDDLLINVTEFFRDSQVFEALKTSVFPDLFKGRDPDDSIRIWVPGCSSGEEVYSLAITLLEYMDEQNEGFRVQIFGTDLSESVLEKARAGVFGESIASLLSAEQLRRFFGKTDAGYQITRNVREMCIFARQNVAKDPPLSKMDLISCRNLLIYLNPALQQRVISTFGYSLRQSGCLLLGSSETLGDLASSFVAKDRENKIFCRRPGVPAASFVAGNLAGSIETYIPAAFVFPPDRPENFLPPRGPVPFKTYTPASLVIDNELRITEFRGNVQPYLRASEGEASLNLDSMVRHEIAIHIRKMIEGAREHSTSLAAEFVEIRDAQSVYSVKLTIVPVRAPKAPGLYVVLIEPAAVTNSSDSAAHSDGVPRQILEPQRHIEHLEKELSSTRQYLQAIIEELRSTNEEAQSANEELQSTNEELQTAKEELQSTNEELHTINSEMRSGNVQLAELNDDLLNLLSSMNTPVIMTGGDLRIRRFTPSAEAVLNLVPSDVGRPISDFQPRIEVPGLNEILQSVLDTLIPYEREVRDHKGGFHLLRIRPYRTSDHRIDGAVLQLIDIGEVKRSLEDARQARDHTKAILDTVRESLLVLDSSLIIQDANRSLLRYFGVARSDIQNQHLSAVGKQFQIPKLKEILERVISAGVPIEEVEVEHEIAAAGVRVLSLSARRMDSGSTGNLILLAIQDITEHKQAAEARYRTLFESAHDGIIIVDATTGDIADINPYFTRLVGYAREDFVGQKIWQAGPMREDDDWRLDFERVREQGVLRVDDRTLRTRDGRSLQVEIVENVYSEAERRVIQFNIRDMTERRKFDQQLQHTAKLESLGLLAGGIAHDFNNLLTGVMGNASLVYTRAALGNPDRPLLREIIRSAERAAHLTRQMLAYAGKGTFLVERIDLANFIPDTLPLIQTSIPKNVEVRLDLSADVPPICADPGQIQQVLMNLIINAAESMGDQPGYVDIETRLRNVEAGVEAADPYAQNSLKPGTYVLICVTDTGCGMDEATRSRIFDPFFTTKFTGRGLGLAAVQGIVRTHEGAVRVYSTPGKGTSFEVFIPPAPPEAPEVPRRVSRRKIKAKGLVLVVDDEPSVRNVAKASLEWAGFDVVIASDGRAAIEIFQERHNEIRAVLLDLLMPVMTGEETLVKMQEIHPGIPIVLISGFDEADALRRFGYKKFCGFVQKPFTMDALRDEISAVLDY